MSDPSKQFDNFQMRNESIEENGLNIYCEAPGTQTDSFSLRVCSEHRLALKKYKHLIDTAPDAIFVADAESGILLEANNAAANLIGVPVEEIIGMHQSQLHPAGEGQRYQELFREYVEKGRGYLAPDMYVQHRNGHKTPIQINAAATQLGDKKVIIGIFRDLTKQKQLEADLQQCELQFFEIFKAAAEGIIVANSSTRKITWAKPSICRMLGYTSEEMLCLKIDDVHPKEAMSSVLELLEKSEDVSVELPCLRKDGSLLYVRINGSVVNTGGKKQAIGFFTDITEEKRLIEEIKASQERFKRLAETTFEAIAIHKNGEIIDANQKLFEMFGYTEQELRQKNGLVLFAPQSQEIIKKYMVLKKTDPYEVIGIKKNGSSFPVEIHARESSINGMAVRIAVLRDLTRQKEMEKQLIESEKKFRQLYSSAQVALYRRRIDDSRLLECNEAFASLLGYDNREQCLVECSVEKHWVDHLRFRDFIEQLQKNGYVQNFQVELTRRDGIPAWVEFEAKLYPEEGYFEGVLFDITAAKILSKLEKQTLTLILKGVGNKQIARTLRRSVRTIEERRANIMRKLHVNGVVELAQKVHFINIDRD